MKATPWQVTPSDWATGFDIEYDMGYNWKVHMVGLKKNPDYLFTDDDRRAMHHLRDELVSKINE